MRAPSPALELWGGLEATAARIGDDYRDQIGETGHHDRLDDIDRIASLGIRTLRFPVLWEAVTGDIGHGRDWHWHDRRLERMRSLGITPILGLVHHGSGPRRTNLLDPAFATGLAAHARQVAERYPWVRAFTPVNEPLTTARFSALYGHWYPHRRSEPDFLRAVVNQCRGIVLAMEAIRTITPGAVLVQTEDLGRVFSTSRLGYQARHENGRRWLSFDLLTGRVTRRHPWWRILTDQGISAGELDMFRDVPPPDVIGINHYLTSDRFLDDEPFGYPAALHASNGREEYADVEAVRIPRLSGRTGPAARLREAWARYRLPIAITEAHHGCTRDEQVRWLAEVWESALAVRREGADIRAVTAWSAMGARDWNSLLTRRDGVYEPGLFDIRGPEPRPTALAVAAASLARTGRIAHPILATPGWWRRPDRRYDATGPAGRAPDAPAIAVYGADGPLRDGLIAAAAKRGLPLRPVRDDRPIRGGEWRGIWAAIDLDIATGHVPTAAAFDGRLRPIVRRSLPFCLVSSAAVFGTGIAAWRETDRPRPRQPVGCEALRREDEALALHPASTLVIRAGRLFGPGAPLPGPAASSPGPDGDGEAGYASYVPDLVHNLLDLLIDGETGIRHLVNPGVETPDGRPRHLSLRRGGSLPVLGTNRGTLMPPLASARAREAERTAPEGFGASRLAAAE